MTSVKSGEHAYQNVLLALDGSAHAAAGAEIVLRLARRFETAVVAAHVYDAGIHSRRFREMEPVLPEAYHRAQALCRIRTAHDDLISEGFEALSRGYMDRFVEQARESGLPVEAVHREGRNYIQLLEIADQVRADLIVLGAQGLGAVPEAPLGGTAGRVLRLAGCDVLLARSVPRNGRILAGIDGSPEALAAAQKAALWADCLKGSVCLAAAYDPFFHRDVFHTIAGSLSPWRRQEIGLDKQRRLHEELIDRGLAELYLGFLKQAATRSPLEPGRVRFTLLKGKAPMALLEHAEALDADLVVVGRYGTHREDLARIGSVSEAVSRNAAGNVLVVHSGAAEKPEQRDPDGHLPWDPEAWQRLERIPGGVRPVARRGIEDHVRARGGRRVTLRDLREAARRFGMPAGGETGRD